MREEDDANGCRKRQGGFEMLLGRGRGGEVERRGWRAAGGWQEGARRMRFVRARDGDGCRIGKGEGWRMGGREGRHEGGGGERTGMGVYITRIYRVGSRGRQEDEGKEEEGRRRGEGPWEGGRGGGSGQIRSSDSELAVLSVTFRSVVREVGPAPVGSASCRVSCTLKLPTALLSSPRTPRTSRNLVPPAAATFSCSSSLEGRKVTLSRARVIIRAYVRTCVHACTYVYTYVRRRKWCASRVVRVWGGCLVRALSEMICISGLTIARYRGFTVIMPVTSRCCLLVSLLLTFGCIRGRSPRTRSYDRRIIARE